MLFKGVHRADIFAVISTSSAGRHSGTDLTGQCYGGGGERQMALERFLPEETVLVRWFSG